MSSVKWMESGDLMINGGEHTIKADEVQKLRDLIDMINEGGFIISGRRYYVDSDGDIDVQGGGYLYSHNFAEILEVLKTPSITPAEVVPLYRWYIDESGDLNFNPSAGDEYVMDFDLAQHEGFSRIDAENLAAWFVQHQPAITEDERLALTDQDRTDGGHGSARSARMLKAIKARVEAAEVVPDASAPASEASADAAHPYWRIGHDDEDGLYLAVHNPMQNDQDEEWPVMFWIKDVEPADRMRARYVAAWLVEHQPTPPAGAVQLSYDEDSHACAIAMSVHVDNLQAAANAEPLPFTPDRAEDAYRSPFDLAAALNTGYCQPRDLRVSFTFDPADILAARLVYAALEQLPYEIRKAVEIR